MTDEKADISLRERLARLLDRDERILWTGRPRQGVIFRKWDIWLIPLSLVWGGFALFWETSVIGLAMSDPNHPSDPIPILFAFWGIPFVLVGLYLIFGRFIHDAVIRRKMEYVVTNQRVMFVNSASSVRTLSHDLSSLSTLMVEENRDGSGNIRFHDDIPIWRNRNLEWRQSPSGEMFEGIPNVKSVYILLRDAQKTRTFHRPI